MGLRPNGKATIWEIKDEEKFSTVSLATRRKNNTGYETDWSNKFCRFIGEAHEKIRPYVLKDGEYINITVKEFEVSNKYDKAKKTLYTNYAIFDFDFIENDESTRNDTYMSIPNDVADDLPFR